MSDVRRFVYLENDPSRRHEARGAIHAWLIGFGIGLGSWIRGKPSRVTTVTWYGSGNQKA